jgi:hypothetical protein
MGVLHHVRISLNHKAELTDLQLIIIHFQPGTSSSLLLLQSMYYQQSLILTDTEHTMASLSMSMRTYVPS